MRNLRRMGTSVAQRIVVSTVQEINFFNNSFIKSGIFRPFDALFYYYSKLFSDVTVGDGKWK
jgi:hypothetical protein